MQATPNGSPLSKFLQSKVDVAQLAGPLLLGGYFVWALFAVFSVQVYTYFQSFKQDRTFIKLLVGVLYTIQIAQVVLITQSQFSRFAITFGDIEKMDEVGTDWISGGILEGVIALIVQAYYAWRIFIISGKGAPAVLITLTSILSFAFAVFVSIDTTHRGHYSRLSIRPVFIETGIWQASTAVCDVLIAVFMTYYLRRRMPEGEQFKRTAEIVTRIIRSSVETGSITACAAVLALIFANIFRTNPYWICPFVTLSGLYCTAFLAVLNGRLGLNVSATTWQEPSRIEWHFQAPQSNPESGVLSISFHV